jgi:hypothetical protein
MKIENAVMKLAEKYNEPKYIETEEDGIISKTYNIKLINLKNYIDEDYIDESPRLDMLYKKILKYFKPTKLIPFPTTQTIDEINKIEDEYPEIKTEEQIFDSPEKAYAERNNIKYDLPDGIEFDLKTAILDNEKLRPAEMMNKYGIKIAGMIWSMEGKIADEHDGFYIKNMVPTIKDDFKLSHYLSEVKTIINKEDRA